MRGISKHSCDLGLPRSCSCSSAYPVLPIFSMVVMEWEQDLCINLINEFRKREILWNPRNTNYYNKSKKEDAWFELGQVFERTSEEVRKKIESLKGSYRREKTRVKRSHEKGKGREVYVSRWFAYELLQFLDDKDDPRRISNNLESASDDTESDNPIDNPIHNQIDLECWKMEQLETDQDQEDVNEDVNVRQPSPSAELSTNATQKKDFKSSKRPIKRKLTREKEDPRIAEAFGYLKEVTTTSLQEKDQCRLFGDFVADYLRKFNNRVRSFALHKIHNLLYELEMSTYERDNVV